MAAYIEDLNVTQTTRFLKMDTSIVPFQVQITVIVPSAVTVNYSLQGLPLLDASSFTAEDVATYTNMENRTETKVVSLNSPTEHLRILINSISGGGIKVIIRQAKRLDSTDKDID